MNPIDRSSLSHAALARRGLMGALLALGGAGMVSATGSSQRAYTAPRTPEEQAAARLRQRRSPNVALLDQDGRSLRFYDDVIKGHKVLLNVMYTVCSNVCTPAMRNLMEARRLLGSEAKDLRFVSISLTPLTDTPDALRAYRKQYGVDQDWTFLTGSVANVERVQRALGFLSADTSDDLLSHSAMARLCDERHLRWTHVNTLLAPRSIARMVRFESV
jgi:protein SCO1